MGNTQPQRKLETEKDALHDKTETLNCGGIKIRIVQGKIATQHADIIVCTVDQTLDLTNDYESNKLLDAAGKEIQNELHRKYPRGIGEGEIAVVSGGKLHCQKVYFVSLLQSEREGVSDSNIKEEIKSIFTACFEKADEGNFTSIALPVIHATNTSYGETVFVNAVCESLADFNIRYRNSTLREVKIVCEYEVLDISKAISDQLDNSNSTSIDKDDSGVPLCKMGDSGDSMCKMADEPTNRTMPIYVDKLAKNVESSVGSLPLEEHLPASQNLTLLKEESNSKTEDAEADDGAPFKTEHYETDVQKLTTSYTDLKDDNYETSYDNNESSDHGIQFRQSLSLKLSMDELTLLDKNDTGELRTMIQETGEENGGLLIGTTTCKTKDNVLDENQQTFAKLPIFGLRRLQGDQAQFPGNIRACIRDNGLKSPVTLSGIKMLCATLEDKYFKCKIKKWIPGYESSDPWELVVVAIVTEEVPDVPLFPDFRLIQRKFGNVSNDAKELFEKEKDAQFRFTSQESGDMQKFITENAESLMQKHSNLLVVRGSKARRNNDKPEVCIVLYVHVKGIIPFGEDPFPNELGGYPVEILEGIFYFAADPKGYIQSLMMGCSVESGHGMCGSIGGFVKLPDDSLGCLTACHVFRPHIEHSGFNNSVYQPVAKPHFKFGEVINHSFAEKWNNQISVDAALIKITDESRTPKSGRFPDAESAEAGFSPENPMLFNCGTVVKSFDEIPIGCTVSKYGAASEHTVGHLNQVSVAARGLEDTLQGDIFYGQMEIIPLKDTSNGVFAINGDSGCLTFMITDSTNGNSYTIRALGMYIGHYHHGGCLVTPIWAILQKFNLPLKLLSFPMQRQEETMEEGELKGRVENLENYVQQQVGSHRVALSNIEDSVGRLGANMSVVKTLQDSIEQMELQMVAVKRKVNANEQSSNMNRYLVDTVKREMMANVATRQADDVSDTRRRIGMVPPLALTNSDGEQDNRVHVSEQGTFQFGACRAQNDIKDQDGQGQEKSEKALGPNSQKPTLYVKPRATI